MLLTTDSKARKQLQLWTFLMEYFPRTFLSVVEAARKGNEQHNPGEPLHWSREKSADQMNAAFNHLFDYGTGSKIDTDGARHLAKAIWRLSAQNELDEEREAEPTRAEIMAEVRRGVPPQSDTNQILGIPLCGGKPPAPTEANGSFEVAIVRCKCRALPLYNGETYADEYSHHGVSGCSTSEISTTDIRSTR